jgi:hypothetical protein
VSHTRQPDKGTIEVEILYALFLKRYIK